MLAWVFWHSPIQSVAEEEYRAALASFHLRIRELQPEGFVDLRVLRYPEAPWLPSPREVYEDWYFFADSAALDHIEQAAIGSHAGDSHRRVVAMAATASGGLYRLRAGAPVAAPSRLTWLNKPREQSYESFTRSASTGGAVWCRQMALGPTPEFCVEGPIDEGLQPHVAHVQEPG